MNESPHPYPHWMLREIREQPIALQVTLDHYTSADTLRSTCDPALAWLRAIDHKVVIAASGSSRHAGLVAELTIEDLSGLVVDVEYASEFIYRSTQAIGSAGVMVISQSGETADTLAALRKARAAGLSTLAVTNVSTSSMANEATVSFPTLAGRERAIPATKSFTAQLLNIQLLSLMSAHVRGHMDAPALCERLAEMHRLPSLLAAQMEGWQRTLQAIAARIAGARSFLFLGRGVHYAIAREGALKLKESAYLHAEGYPSGELKHGPNALVAEGTPLVMIATVDHASPESVERYKKIVQLLQDMHRQGAQIIAVANTGDTAVAALAKHAVFVEPVRETLMPICEVVPLQLLAYFMAVQSGIDVDRPRNLSKAVLAE